MKEEYKILTYSALPRSGHHFTQINICSWLGVDRSLHYWDFEGTVPPVFNRKFDIKYKKWMERVEKKNLDPPSQIIKIISNRDLMNWIASLLKANEKGKRQFPTSSIKSWTAYTKEIYGLTDYMPDSIKFIYDDFVQSQEYRQNICNKLGGIYNEDSLNVVPGAFRGSSFDETKFNGRGSQMKVLERYTEYLDDPNYIKLFKENPEAVELYTKYFNLSNQQKTFIESLNI